MQRSVGAALLLALLAMALPAATIPGHYVVELVTPSVAEQILGVARPGRPTGNRAWLAAAGGAAIDAHRGRLRGEQRLMRRRLEERQARVLGAVDTVANGSYPCVSFIG